MNTYPSVRMYTIFFIFWYIFYGFIFFMYISSFLSCSIFWMVFLLLIIHYHNYYWILEYQRSLKVVLIVCLAIHYRQRPGIQVRPSGSMGRGPTSTLSNLNKRASLFLFLFIYWINVTINIYSMITLLHLLFLYSIHNK